MTLTDFLLARIASREKVLHSIRAEAKSMRDKAVDAGARDDLAVHRVWFGWVEADLLAERELVECEAKRRIVERFAWTLDAKTGPFDPETNLIIDGRDTIRDLALAYADHPDYREEWRP